MSKYRIVQVGLGARGIAALRSFNALKERLEIVGICDMNTKRLESAANEFVINPDECFTDVAAMLETTRPDIFSFCTLPDVRFDLIKLAHEYGVDKILFEKPMATTLLEARKILEYCRDNSIKAVVCHQHKYFEGFQRLKNIIDSGELGEIDIINADCQAWFSQIGSHYIDYSIWACGCYPIAATGHVHGRDLLTDSHPSPNYLFGELVFPNGVRSNLRFGYMAKPHNSHSHDYERKIFPIDFWEDDRLTVYGTTGYAWAECNGKWGAFTKNTQGNVITGSGNSYHDEKSIPVAQIAYMKDFLDWADGIIDNHSCNVEIAYRGFEAGIAIILSAIENKRVDLPIIQVNEVDEIERMKECLPECGMNIHF